MGVLMQDEEELIATMQATLDIQADRFPIVPETVIQKEEPVVSDIVLQEAVAATSTPRTPPQAPVALLPPLMRPSMQQILDVVMDSPRPPMPLESRDSIPDIVVFGPSRDEDDEDMTGPTPALPSDDTSSLSPQRARKKEERPFRCPHCPNTRERTFKRQFDMKRHIRNTHQEKTPEDQRKLTRPSCYEVLSRPDAFRRHYLKVPGSCVRVAKLKNKSDPPAQPESLYKLCRAGFPPAPDMSTLRS